MGSKAAKLNSQPQKAVPMATIPTTSDIPATTQQPPSTKAPLLIALAPQDPDGLTQTLQHLAEALPGESLLVATPNPVAESALPNIRLIAAPTLATDNWLLTAADFQSAARLAKEQNAAAVLLLGADSGNIPVETLRTLTAGIAKGADLIVPGYRLGPREGLVNSAILYPVTRALFGTRPRYPMAIDLGLSLRMAERLGTAAQRYTAINQPEALLWPIAEATSAGFTIHEVPGINRPIPPPNAAVDLNSVLARVAGSLFADVDAKAALWQRIRTTQPRFAPVAASHEALDTPDVSSMIETFRIGYTNLAEIWSLVLPPNSLLGLKRLASAPAESFLMPDALWARTVFDFILAYRLRTLNRGHLLGALTPLYLAWVASHLLQATDATAAERHIEAVATAFEADKPYLVSRWRWPDRFNP
jgi:hypothetical protein